MSARDRLTDAERAAFRAAEAAGYLVVTERMSEVIGAWAKWCDARGHPLVIIESRLRGCAVVTLDTITCLHDLTRAQEKAIDAAFNAAGAREGHWGGEYSFGTVRWEVAESLARTLLQIVLGPGAPEGSP